MNECYKGQRGYLVSGVRKSKFLELETNAEVADYGRKGDKDNRKEQIQEDPSCKWDRVARSSEGWGKNFWVKE